jgi:hypothetical protein
VAFFISSNSRAFLYFISNALMKEKLLALLKTKFAGVQDATLDRIATKKSETVTDEAQLKTIVDGINFADVLQSETDYRVTEAQKTAVANYEKKHKLKDGKIVEDPKPADPTPGDPKPGDPKQEETPAWAKALIAQNKQLADTVASITKGQQVSSKQSQALELLKKSKIPEKLHGKWINRINVESEIALEDQIKELETEYLDTHQSIIAQTVKEGNFVPAAGGKVEAAEMTEYLDEKFPKAQEVKV